MSALAGKRERTKEANRAAILDAALHVFADVGYGAATVRDVIRRTGLASGTFYNYFPDKESVFRALIEDVAREAAVRTHAARAAATTAEAFIAEGYRAYFGLLVEDRATVAVMRRNAGTIRQLLDEPAIGAGADQLAADLREAVASGLVARHDTGLMAAAMTGAGIEVGLRMLEAEPPDVEGAVAFCTGLFVGGLERLGNPG